MELRRRRFLLSNDRTRMVNGTIQLLAFSWPTMPNARQEASLTQIRRLLSRWDQGMLNVTKLSICQDQFSIRSRFEQSSSTDSSGFHRSSFDHHWTRAWKWIRSIRQPLLHSHQSVLSLSLSLFMETYSCLFSVVVTHQLSLRYLSERTTTSSARLPSIVDRQ